MRHAVKEQRREQHPKHQFFDAVPQLLGSEPFGASKGVTQGDQEEGFQNGGKHREHGSLDDDKSEALTPLR